MVIIDEKLLNEVSAQAKVSPRLRMNYNFHLSLDEKCHGWLCLPLSRLGIVQASLASALTAPSVLECGGAGDGGGDSSTSREG